MGPVVARVIDKKNCVKMHQNIILGTKMIIFWGGDSLCRRFWVFPLLLKS